MKKRFSVLLLSILIIPLFSLLGCGAESVLYPITVYSSSTIYGAVSGTGSYQEGSTTTLTATAKQGSSFVAWIFENSTQIETNETYHVSNTTSADEKITKSTLTFTSSKSTQGMYTAVFREEKIMYAKFTGMYLSTTLDSQPIESSPEQPLMSMDLNLLQGTASLKQIYTTEETPMKDSVYIAPEKIVDVIKLSTTIPQHILATTKFVFGEQSKNFTFRADLLFQTNATWVNTSNYSYKTTFEDGVYDIVFKFNISEQNYYLVLQYTNL